MLSYQIYDIADAFWSNTSSYYYHGISNLTTDPDTRALSMSLSRNGTLYSKENATLTKALRQLKSLDPNFAKFIAFQCYLLYERASGQLTVLFGSFNYTYPSTTGVVARNESVGASWICQNLELSPQLMSYMQSAWGSGPFSSSIAPPLYVSATTFDLATTTLLFPELQSLIFR